MTLSSIFSSPYRMPSPRTESADDRPMDGAELVTPDGRALPLASATLRAEAAGGLARVVLEQRFENPYADTLHVTYKMPLPADGAVSGYEFAIGGRTITGRVEPKAVAREQFEQAIVEGRTAALLEQQRADLFTQEIGNIPPGESIVARITVDQRLTWLPEGEWELRFPTVIGPRYVGASDTPADAEAVSVDVATKEEVRARIHLEVEVGDEIVAGRRVTSPSHAIARREDQARPELYVLSAPEGARLDRDIVVRWPVARAEVGIGLAVARPPAKQPHAHVAYGLVTIVPPAPDARARATPRDLVLLIDTSGSMSGEPLEQAKRAVSLLVGSLEPQDQIEMIEFSSEPKSWTSSPRPANAATKKSALEWIRKLKAGGATEMYSAIVEALRALRPGAQRQVVLVTDGYIGGEQQIVELLHERLPADCRLHVVGVGSAVNRSLATSLSRAGRGAEVLLGLDEDAERAARRLLDRTARPVLTNVSIEGDAVVELAPMHVPDVFAGCPVVAAAKLAAGGGELIVRGQLAGGAAWERRLSVGASREGEGNQAIVSLFGREHVADLEMRWTIGRETELIDRTIERTGVVFQIATRMTSWVAIDQVRSGEPSPGGHRRAVQPQELPYGTTMSSFGLGGLAEGGTSTRAGTLNMAMHDLVAGYGAPPAPAALRSVTPSQGMTSTGERMRRAGGAPPPSSMMHLPSSSLPAPLSKKRSPLARVLAIVFVLLVLFALVLLAWRSFR